MKKWIVIMFVCILAAAVLIAGRLFPHALTYEDIMEGKTPMFDCVVAEYSNEKEGHSILVIPVETCEAGNKKDRTDLTKPVRIFENELKYENFDAIREDEKNNRHGEYVYTVHYKDESSFEEKDDEIIMHDVYVLTQAGRKTDYDKEQCVNCKKGCKAD